MKLHNLSVIFVIIAIPLILITSYYISLQIDTINMQTAYNTKLLDSTKEAIDAFEINTVEWNANYSETADSKRRDVMASINTFINSFANNLGIGGASKETIMAYMPAIAYTLYDGYYVYSPANTKVAIKDENGVGVVMTKKLWEDNKELFSGYSYKEENEGKLLYEVAEGTADGTYKGTKFTLDQEKAKTEYKHILKPFATYSEKIGDWVINYTLDNYITIYGKVKNEETEEEEFVSKAGYLTDLGRITGISNNSVSEISFNGIEVKPETLSEQIAYKNGIEYVVGTFNYVYEADGNTKVYFDDEGKAFIVGNDLVRTYLTENINRYKKVTIPQYKSKKWTYKEIYQNLYDGKWYDKEKKDVIAESNTSPGYGIDENKMLDYSAINYCVESYIVTKFVNSLDLKLNNSEGTCICGYSHGNSPLTINSDNDPEKQDSDFSVHKRGIIKNVIESNLNQAITSYSRNSSNGEYKLPKLAETDWDQILRNVSIITFIQNIPIGMKYYNNYAIATSTMNKEYVDPEEIYLNATGDEYYHMPYCKELTKTDNMIGYRSIDYVQKSYTQKKESGEDETKYYYKHSNTGNINVNQACYYCLVQKSLYKENKTDNKAKAYYTALARERYAARMAKLPAEVEASYYINVIPYTIENGEEKIATNARYSINNTEYIGKSETKINKETPKSYNITTTISGGRTLSETDSIVTSRLGDYNNPNETTSEAKNDAYSLYKTDSNATVTVGEYTTDGIKFEVKVEGKNCKWTAGYSTDTTEQMTQLGPEEDGYINIKLYYERNYTDGGKDTGITATANINDSNNLTIVTNTGNITGFVRLRFTNTNIEGNTVTYYSNDIFNIKNAGSSIYCEVKNDYNWYKSDWKVDVLNVAGEVIKSTNKMEYYTIRDATGLKGFSNAVNGTVGPETGAKTEERTFKVIEDISGVGEMAPIAGVNKPKGDGWNKIWFKGNFQGIDDEGKNHTISGITMSYTNDEIYNSFGLFGWVGEKANISNLNVEINVASFNSSELKDEDRDNRICIGGIAGYTDGQINNCTISSSNIGAGPINVNSRVDKKDIYYVGGIAGYTKGAITNCKVESNVKVKGGKINHSNSTKLNKFLETYAGGLIGYKATNQEINNTFSVNCTVEGYDNVGGIIGFNAGGNINSVSFNGTIQGDGENIGGIVGCNTGGNISNCTNTISISVENAKNVGGIVGLNSDKNITNCKNNGTVTGKKNVGGIVGLANGGEIKSATNKNTISAKNNSVIGETLDFSDLQAWYNISGENATGAGGIAGKIYNTNILQSSNEGTVQCNFTGGGIVGMVAGGNISYCFNKGDVIKNISDNYANRIGGIIGVGGAFNVYCCYNIGKVQGITSWLNSPLASPVGGIIGLVIDDGSHITTGTVTTKYLEIDINYLRLDSYHNEISYCYNAGKIIGHYSGAEATDLLDIWEEIKNFFKNGNLDNLVKNENEIKKRLWYNGAIVGYIAINIDIDFSKDPFSTTKLTDNYYLEGSSESGGGRNGRNENEKYQPLAENKFKEKLYNWADSLTATEGADSGKFIYDTTAPLETDKGYEGYGVLWWELKDYAKLKVYICSSNNKIPDKQEVEMIINGKSVILSDSNLGTYTNEEQYHNWIMMIPKGETQYILGGKTKSTATKNIPAFKASNDEIIKLIDIGGMYDNLIVHADRDATINWSNIVTKVERYNVRVWPDTALLGTGKHVVFVEYNGKIGDSKTEINFTKDNLANYNDGKFGSVFMDGDKRTEASVITEDPYKTYYIYKDTAISIKEEKKQETGSEIIQGKSACVIKIPIERIDGKTGTKGIVFSKTNSTIQKAKAKLRVGIYVPDNFFDRIGTTMLNDTLHVSVAFGNSGDRKVERKIGNSYDYTKNNIDWLPDFTYEFSETSEIPEEVTVKLQWDANVVGVYVAIDYLDVDVTYYTK